MAETDMIWLQLCEMGWSWVRGEMSGSCGKTKYYLKMLCAMRERGRGERSGEEQLRTVGRNFAKRVCEYTWQGLWNCNIHIYKRENTMYPESKPTLQQKNDLHHPHGMFLHGLTLQIPKNDNNNKISVENKPYNAMVRQPCLTFFVQHGCVRISCC